MSIFSGEYIPWAFLGCVCFRYVYVLHCTWLVNSAAHLWGEKPYDKSIKPKENSSVIYLAFGEGYHNYHHTFPWDYSASELGWNGNFNLTTALIDFFAWTGLAYDLKKATPKIVHSRQQRSGDPKSIIFKRSKLWVIKDWILGILITTSSLWIAMGFRHIILSWIMGCQNLYIWFN